MCPFFVVVVYCIRSGLCICKYSKSTLTHGQKKSATREFDHFLYRAMLWGFECIQQQESTVKIFTLIIIIPNDQKHTLLFKLKENNEKVSLKLRT